MRVSIEKGITAVVAEILPATHAFLGRSGGVSPPPYNSLNAGFHVGDEKKNVEKNISEIAQAFGFERSNLICVKQVHGNGVVTVKSPAEHSSLEADAVITAVKAVAIGVVTADCAPVLLYDHRKKAVGAIHAGWKGIAAGVVEAAVGGLTDADPSSIVAAIGPAIGPCCYTVGAEVIEEFKKRLAAPRIRENRLDLGASVKTALISSGLLEKNIESSGLCTACRGDLFFSYRRDGTTGRQLSFIMKG
jgi:YfiH family protein